MDVIGRRFGFLVVEKREKPKVGRSVFVCRCDCGNTLPVARPNKLTSGQTISCGCKRRTHVRFDLSGQRFGKLVALHTEKDEFNSSYWVCRCDCGKTTMVMAANLKNGNTGSCGCRRGGVTHGHTRGATHKSPTYSSWQAMVARCTHPSNSAFEHYRKLGIMVCDRWRHGEGGLGGFECFLADMGERPSKAMTIDRFPNNDGNYEVGNCRWATRRQQANNRRTNAMFEYLGEMMTFAELVRRTGMDKELLRHRLLRAGWSVEEAISAPKQQGRRIRGSRPHLSTP